MADRRVAWSRTALRDLHDITAFIRRDSKHYASTVEERIKDVAASLAKFPESGRIGPELDDPRYRERLVDAYRLVYYLDGEAVNIIAIIHARRSFGGAVRNRI